MKKKKKFRGTIAKEIKPQKKYLNTYEWNRDEKRENKCEWNIGKIEQT